ncbi:MAG: DNA-binding protein [Candidatus Accumulibacter sp.]|jgi:hypothetical protein|nr:DNA-binding protein [Candidatus Accumulibacter necessarius]
MSTDTKLSRKLSTEEFADVLRYKATTVRSVLCRSGSFKGIQPVKLPGGRLLWDADEAAALANGTLKVSQ